MNLTAKNIALLSHFPLVGPIIAYVKYQEEKSPLVGFYMRQTIGIMVMWVIAIFIQNSTSAFFMVGSLLKLVTIVAWVISLLGAINGQQKLVPYIGEVFQDFFKSL